MAVEFKPTAYPGDFPVFWRGEAKMLPGGFRLKQTFPVGTLIRKGVALCVNFALMEAAVVKIAKVVAGGTTTKPRVIKGTMLQPGDTVMKLGDGTKSVTVKSVSIANASYDEIELSAALTGIAIDDYIQESTEAVAANGDVEAVQAEAMYAQNMVVGANLEITKSGVQAVDAAFNAVVLKDSVYPFPDSWLIDPLSPNLKLNPNIMFIKQ